MTSKITTRESREAPRESAQQQNEDELPVWKECVDRKPSGLTHTFTPRRAGRASAASSLKPSAESKSRPGMQK